MISTPEDWAEVGLLRTSCDAILVGAETLRRDDPSLLMRNDEVRRLRREIGLKPDIAKVCLTRSGRLPATAKFFTQGECDRYVFTNTKNEALDRVAHQVVVDEELTARYVVTELEKRGIQHLLVEGGKSILEMFLREGMCDVLRVAVNPQLTVGERGYAHLDLKIGEDVPCERETLGGMEVTQWTFHPDTENEDFVRLTQAIEVSKKCTPSQTSYCVGAVIVTAKGEEFTGYTHETSPTHHAEQEAIKKALEAGAELRGAAIYSSMEPCSKRASEPRSCTELILDYGFTHVAFALYEPSCFVSCRGALTLREAGVDVKAYTELGEEVMAVNSHLLK